MELYTSLTRLKMALNGGVLPPMAPLTERAKKSLDPAFTPGMGAIEEDLFKGLRCPLRGCGRYFHQLSRHLRYAHRKMGGARAVRVALDIPRSVPLASCWERALLTDRTRSRILAGTFFPLPGGNRLQFVSARTHRLQSAARRSVMARNLGDRCTAQLAHRILDLTHKIGRSPSSTEFRQEYGRALLGHVETSFGTWNAAKGHCGLSQYVVGATPKWDLDGILSAFEAYHQAHSHLPTISNGRYPSRTPLLPNHKAVHRVLKTKSWPEAMRQVAAALGITGGRYGLPTTKSAA